MKGRPRRLCFGLNCGPAFVFVSGCMWACDGIFRPYVSTRMNAQAMVAWEHILSLIPLFPLIFRYLIQERKALSLKQWFWLFALGVGSDAIANTMLTLGYSLGHLALVALLQQAQPVFGLLLACLVLQEDFHARVFIPLSLLALVGLILMMWPYVQEASHEDDAMAGVLAGAYGLGAAVIWASETVVGRWLLQHASPTLTSAELLTYRQFIGLVSLCVYVFIISARPLCQFTNMECVDPVMPNPFQIFIIGIIAINELLSHLLYYVGLNSTPASVAVIMELSNPLLILTVVPTLTKLFDPQYKAIPLESEQIVGALLLTVSTALLGIYSSMMEEKEEEMKTSAALSSKGSEMSLHIDDDSDDDAHRREPLPQLRTDSMGGMPPASTSPPSLDGLRGTRERGALQLRGREAPPQSSAGAAGRAVG